MFRRPFHDLLNILVGHFPECGVEIYHRTRLEEFKGVRESGKGCAAQTHIRIISREGMRHICIADQVPVAGTVLRLLDLATPEASGFPIVCRGRSGRWSSRHLEQGFHNWRGLARDIVVNSSGTDAVAEVLFSLHRWEGTVGLAPMDGTAEWRTERNAVFLTPAGVARAIIQGAFRDYAARQGAISLFHDSFDGIGGDAWEWGRTPRNLGLVLGSLTLTGVPTEKYPAGSLLDSLEWSPTACVGIRGGEPICTFEPDVLESCTAISQVFSFYDGGVYWRLPFIQLRGAIHWH